MNPDTEDEDDIPPVPKNANLHPSAAAIVALERLLSQPPSVERARQAWRAVTGAAGNPDFHAVLDYATDHDLIRACDPSDPKAANVSWVNPLDGSEMIWIPGGRFTYGRAGETAECDGFSLARWPVTNEQFRTFLGETGYKPDPRHPDNQFLAHWSRGAIPAGKERHPVVYVSLFDALAYGQWAGLTLPTEWLWEKAARGTDGRMYPWGDSPPGNGSKKLAHVAARGTTEVGSYGRVRSPYGCEDLIGNVSEWTLPLDENDPPGRFPPPWPQLRFSDSHGTPLLGVIRGACFMRTGHASVTSSHRRRLSISRRNHWTGFRLAALLPCRPAEEGKAELPG